MGCPLRNPLLFMLSVFSNFNYSFHGLSDSGVILKELGQNLRFIVKGEVLTMGTNPLIYIIKNIRA